MSTLHEARWHTRAQPRPGTAREEPGEGMGRAEVAPESRRRAVRGILGTAAFAFGLYIYTLVQDLATPRTTFVMPLDGQIPFVPEMMLAYLMFFFFVPLAAFTASRENFTRVVLACLLAAGFGWICFLLVPASMGRPDPSAIENPALRTLFGLLHAVDDSHNTFPSLHVAVTFISCAAFRGTRFLWLAVTTALVIAASTLLVKQHTVLDVAGGALLALLAYYAAAALTRWVPLRLLPSGRRRRTPLGR